MKKMDQVDRTVVGTYGSFILKKSIAFDFINTSTALQRSTTDRY